MMAMTCRAGDDLPDGPSVSIAPLINGFNDPNAIRYDPAHEARCRALQDEWEPDAFELRQGVAATIDIAGEYGRATKYVCVHDAQFVPLGRQFRSEDLVRFLDRRANGDLAGRTSDLMVRGIRTAIDLCAQAEIRLSLPAMNKLLDDPNPEVRNAACYFIACVGPDDDALFARLCKAMQDPEVAARLAPNFHRFGQRGLRVLLDAAMRHPSRTVIYGLAEYPTIDSQTVMHLATLLENPDKDVRIAAAGVLSHFGDQARGAIPALVALHARDESYPHDIAYADLAQMSEEGRDAMMADARRSVRDYRDAMDAMGSYGLQTSGRLYRENLPILIAALRHDNAEVRKAAARSLGCHAAYAAVPELTRLLADPNADVRSQAAWSLGEIGDPSAIPALKKSIPDNPEAAEAVCDIERYLSLRHTFESVQHP